MTLNKPITASDTLGFTCCRIETITGHQFIHSLCYRQLFSVNMSDSREISISFLPQYISFPLYKMVTSLGSSLIIPPPPPLHFSVSWSKMTISTEINNGPSIPLMWYLLIVLIFVLKYWQNTRLTTGPRLDGDRNR